MRTFLYFGLTGAVGLTMLVAGTGHLIRSSDFAREVMSQRLIPARAARFAARSIAVVEMLLGVAVLLSAVRLVPERAITWILAAGAVMAAGFAAYAALLLKLRPGAPCACFGSSRPVSASSVARALALSAFAVIAAVAYRSELVLSTQEGLISAAAAVATASLLIAAPDSIEGMTIHSRRRPA